ncbi:heme exporter protein CcmD [Novosphingobium sp. TH158]|nr:heme exporter protein CcmD [Novosphingobium sp. TH158]
MQENLDHWSFVIAAYAIGLVGVLGLTAWAWISMRRAEARRDRSREK